MNNIMEINELFENLETDLIDLSDIFQSFKRMVYLFSNQKFSINSPIPKDCFLENKEQIYIGHNCKIERGAFIRGPCIIGNNSEIRHAAYVRGNVITGENCIIGHSTEIKDSILLGDTHAAHFAYIGNSIIGRRANLGAGVKLANLRLDRKNVIVKFFDQKIDSGLTKLGSLIGDDVQIGCNAVLSPGTIVRKRGKIFPLQHVIGFI